jgi:site-specific recombinase XerD
MILGRGEAKSDAAILAEYRSLLCDPNTSGVSNPAVLHSLEDAPVLMLKSIGKPVAQWSCANVLRCLLAHQKSARYYRAAFVAFLIFRGYFCPTLDFIAQAQLELSRMHRDCLAPFRRRVEDTHRSLGYGRSVSGAGTLLNVLIALLATTGKPLNEITRDDFEIFRSTYQSRYRALKMRADGRPDARIFRLESILVQWQVIPRAQRVFKHDLYFAQLKHAAIRKAILIYLRWCDSAYSASTINSCRAGILTFFLWLQERHPDLRRLDGVTRDISVEFAAELKARTLSARYTAHYATDLNRRVRLFYQFCVDERVPTAPLRCPFHIKDIARSADPVPRYLTDTDIQAILRYCSTEASLYERVIVTTLLHTGIRAAELAALKASDVVQIQGRWKLHIHEGKGLKDRLIPLTDLCLATLREWQDKGWNRTTDHLFSHFGLPWRTAAAAQAMIRRIGQRLGVDGLTPHRFRHTFAVALLNYGMRESALQKLMGHATVGMTLEYARILDKTVEAGFNLAVEKMQDAVQSQVPTFWRTEDYTLFAEGDTVSWIRLPHGYCRRNPKLHCESDVKCLICDRFAATPEDLPRLRAMHDRFVQLGMTVKANVVAAQIARLKDPARSDLISLAELHYPAAS